MFKKLVNFRMRSGIASVAVMVCLAWAGMNFSASGEAEFVEVEAALKNAIAGSDATNPCYNTITSLDGHQVRYCPSCSFIDNSKAAWFSPQSKC
jgi:hypothetical protein